MSNIPYGYCHCGCGEKTNLASQTIPRRQMYKGKPNRYVAGHQSRKSPIEYITEERGWLTPCWIWQKTTTHLGYGRIYLNRKGYMAHRVYYERRYGTIPKGKELDHLCRVTACVNPDHLEPVSHAENLQRKVNAKLTAEDVRQIRFLAATTELTARQIAEPYGVDKAHVSRIIKGKKWLE